MEKTNKKNFPGADLLHYPSGGLLYSRHNLSLLGFEICLDCFNKMLGENYTEKDYLLSKELCFCEDCEQMKHIVVREKRNFIFPFFRLF